MNLADLLILAALVLTVVLTLRSSRKRGAKGCGCNCASCPNPCKAVDKAPEEDYNKHN